MGYGKATQSFYVNTNNFATIKLSSVRSKHLMKYLVYIGTSYVDQCIAVGHLLSKIYMSFQYTIQTQVSKDLLILILVYTGKICNYYDYSNNY